MNIGLVFIELGLLVIDVGFLIQCFRCVLSMHLSTRGDRGEKEDGVGKRGNGGGLREGDREVRNKGREGQNGVCQEPLWLIIMVVYTMSTRLRSNIITS